MSFSLALCAGLSLTAGTTQAADQNIVSTIQIQRPDGSPLTVLESNWSQAVFNSDFHAWLVNFVAKINAVLTQYLAEQQGPADQAALEAALTAKLQFDDSANKVVIL